MRITTIKGAECDETRLVEQTTALISGEIEKDETLSLVGDHPDVVHIIGAWERSSMSVARQAAQRHIAVVYTPLSSLAPWYHPSASKTKLTAEASCVVASGAMEHTMLSGAQLRSLALIKNPVITASTSAEEMLSAYKEVYSQACDANETLLQQHVAEKIALLNVADTTITELCRRLLYAHYLYQRRNIPLQFLKELAAYMTASDYDEERMAKLLRLLSLDLFTQQLEFAMKEKAGLTEGFMPIVCKEDKTAKDIIETITDFNNPTSE